MQNHISGYHHPIQGIKPFKCVLKCEVEKSKLQESNYVQALSHGAYMWFTLACMNISGSSDYMLHSWVTGWCNTKVISNSYSPLLMSDKF